MSIDVGARLRSVRTTFGMSQRELARRAGVTNGLISLIEQNRVSPSVSSLKKVLDGVPMSLAEFFTLDLSATPQAFFSADDLVELGNPEVSLRLGAAQRPGRQLTVLHERYAAGAATGEEMLTHRGEEAGASSSRWAALRACWEPARPIISPASFRIASATSGARPVRSSAPAPHRPSEGSLQS